MKLPCLLSLASFATVMVVPAQMITWDGDCNEWWDGGCPDPQDPNIPPRSLTNWDNESVPLQGAAVLINGGRFIPVVNVTVPGLASIEARTPLRIRNQFTVLGDADFTGLILEQTGSLAVKVGGALTLNGDSAWTGGNVEDTGSFVNRGSVTLQGNSVRIDNTTFLNAGTVNSSGSRDLRNGGTISNGGLWNIASPNADILGNASNGRVFFDNHGTLRRSGSGIAKIDVEFINRRAIEAMGGTLNVTRGGRFDGGFVTMANNADLQFLTLSATPMSFDGEVWVSGAGNLIMGGSGIHTINGTLTSNLDESSRVGLSFANGSTVMINGSVRNNGLASWMGTEAGGGTASGVGFFNQGRLILNGARLQTRLLNGRDVVQLGNVIMENGLITVGSTGTWVIEDADIRRGGGENGFELIGQLIKTAPLGLGSSINVPVTLAGQARVDVRESSLQFRNSGVIAGFPTFQISENAEAALAGGTFRSGGSVTGLEARMLGLGTFRVADGVEWRLGGRESTIITDLGTFDPDLGAFDRIASDTPASGGFILDGGTIIGMEGALLINHKRFVWQGGAISLPTAVSRFQDLLGGFVNHGDLEIISSGTLGGRMRNRGIVDHSNGILIVGANAELINSSLYCLRGARIEGPGIFSTGDSLFEILCSNGNSSIAARFIATGTVMVDDGVLTISNPDPATVNGDVLQSGHWSVSREATLSFPGRTIRAVGGRASLDLRGSIPQLQLDAIERGGTLELGDGVLRSGNLNNSGTLKDGSRIEADSVTNEEEGEVESVLDFLTEALVPSAVNPRKRYNEGFVVKNGFVNAGQIHPGGRAATGYFPVNGNFSQTGSGVLNIELGGTTILTAKPAGYDHATITGTAALDGLLTVSFVNGFETNVMASDSFVILEAGGITGSFDNATHGERLFTADNRGSFLVNVTGQAVILSDFQPGGSPAPPEPPTLAVTALPDEGVVQVELRVTPGVLYDLLESEDLARGWDHLRQMTPNAAGQARIHLPVESRTPHRFFHGRLPGRSGSLPTPSDDDGAPRGPGVGVAVAGA